MNRYKLLIGWMAFLFLLLPGGVEKSDAAGLNGSELHLSSGNFLGFGDQEEGYILKASKPAAFPEAVKDNFSFRIPFDEENLRIAPVLQKSKTLDAGFQNDLSLLNNGYGLEYGVGIGYTLPFSEFNDVGEVRFTMNLMPRVNETSSLFPQARGLSKVELGVGYRPVSNAELFVKYMSLRDVLQRQDLFSSLADAVEVGAQLAF